MSKPPGFDIKSLLRLLVGYICKTIRHILCPKDLRHISDLQKRASAQIGKVTPHKDHLREKSLELRVYGSTIRYAHGAERSRSTSSPSSRV